MRTLNKIYRDLKNRIRDTLPTIAYEIGDKMFNKYVDCVQAFYDDMPESDGYYRTYSTFLGSSISYSYDEKTTGSLRNDSGEDTTFSIHVNMKVDPTYLGDPYHDPVDYVFERTWIYGIHGNLANKVMEPAPWDIFDEWFDGFINPKTGDVKLITNRNMLKKVGIGSR